MKKEIIEGKVIKVEPTTIVLEPFRVFRLPRPLPYIAEDVPVGSVVRLLVRRSGMEVIYASSGAEGECYVEAILNVKK